MGSGFTLDSTTAIAQVDNLCNTVDYVGIQGKVDLTFKFAKIKTMLQNKQNLLEKVNKRKTKRGTTGKQRMQCKKPAVVARLLRLAVIIS